MMIPSSQHSRLGDSPVTPRSDSEGAGYRLAAALHPLPGRHAVSALIDRRFPHVFRALTGLRSEIPERLRTGLNPQRSSLLARSTALIDHWRSRARERQTLAAMSDLALKDLGLTRLQVLPEINKPFWRQ
jgi:uncharacterized protein YjiS (DUF1127 family)